MPSLSANAKRSFNADYYSSLVRSSLGAEIDPRDASDFYCSNLDGRRISPNPLFSEVWYRNEYKDVSEAIASGKFISGYVHYCNVGFFERRFPSFYYKKLAAECNNSVKSDVAPEFFDAGEYLARNADARLFMENFPWVEPVRLYNLLGRYIGHHVGFAGTLESSMYSYFDPEFYKSTYGLDSELSAADAFQHYLGVGVRAGHSPSLQFNETWYRAFYKDVRDSIGQGFLRNGLHHYLVAGQAEGRLPVDNKREALEKALPGVTAPTLLNAVDGLEAKLNPAPAPVRNDGKKIFWFVCPRLNPDMVFGGYRAAFQLLSGLKTYLKEQTDYSLGVLLTEEYANMDYFRYRLKPTSPDVQLFADIPVVSVHQAETDDDDAPRFGVGPQDRFLCYSCWDAWYARAYVKQTDCARFFSLVQENEAIFHPSGTMQALSEAAFRLNSYQIFNSHELASYFRKRKLGVFARDNVEEGKDFGAFQHVPTKLPVQTVDSIRGRRDKWIVMYARPEIHALRNMFDLCVLALRQACAEKLFDESWNFLGLGTLSECLPVDLGGRHKLVLKKKLSESEYINVMNKIDIGISLMHAPHPSVVPFEFASTGALVVTNTYQDRDEAFFAGISPNIIASEASVDGLVDGLRKAVAQQGDAEGRIANRLKIDALRWDDVFNTAFFDRHVRWAVS